MCKKLCFLVSFVLVLGLSSAVQAGTPIDVNNYSFELDCDGAPVFCHTGHIGVPGEQCDASIAAWRYTEGGAGWTGIDVNCEGVIGCDTPPDCKDWLVYTDGRAHLFFQGNSAIHQILDFDIALGQKYTMTVDLLAFNDDIVLEFFAIDDPNFPDANHIVISQTVHNVGTVFDANVGRNLWELGLTAQAVVLDSSLVGKKLGIKIGGDYLVGGTTTGNWLWVDNVRLEWDWATNAWDPDPANGADEVAKTALTLSWKPGGWAAGHEVYFGTDQAAVEAADTTDTTGVYRGSGSVYSFLEDPNDANTIRYAYDVPETLDLVQTYYWRIDETNAIPPGGPVPAPPWKGDVWSFETEGRAKDPSPADGATNQSPEVTLGWTAGVLATSHDVYLGTDQAAVEAADTTDTTGIYRTTQGTTSYDPPGSLVLGVTYYWRIDENSAGPFTARGHVWSFTVAPFSVVDDFDSYDLSTNIIRDTWKDYWTDPVNNGGEVILEEDPNFDIDMDGNSMKFRYENDYANSKGNNLGSWAEADIADLIVSSDWTAGGIKALVLNFYGLSTNTAVAGSDDLQLTLQDTSANTGTVIYPDTGALLEESWHEWNIDLTDPNFAGVNMSSIARITVKTGGPLLDGKSAGTGVLYFDDFVLWPRRCRPEISAPFGDFNADCDVNTLDLDTFAGEWLRRGQWGSAIAPDTNGVVQWKMDEGTGTNVANTGTWAGYNLTIGQSIDPNGDFYIDPNNNPTWVNDPCRGWVLYLDGEAGWGDPGEDPEFLGGDYLLIPALNLNSNTVTITGWIKPDPCIPGGSGFEQRESFTGLLVTRSSGGLSGRNPGNTAAAGISYSSGKGFSYNGQLGYVWNDNSSSTWGFNTDIFMTDFEWNFVAVTIAPDAATVYKVDESGVLETATNAIPHQPEEWDANAILGGDLNSALRFFRGSVSDFRVYDKTLSIGEIMGLAGVEGTVYIPLKSDADLVEGNKNPPDPNTPIDDQVDFTDFAKFAEVWEKDLRWPIE